MEEDSGLEGSQTLQNLAAGRLAESASRMRCTSWRWRVGSILMSVLVVAQIIYSYVMIISKDIQSNTTTGIGFLTCKVSISIPDMAEISAKPGTGPVLGRSLENAGPIKIFIKHN